MAYSPARDAVFDYPKGQFTVTEVDSETFRECYLQAVAELAKNFRWGRSARGRRRGAAFPGVLPREVL